MASSWFNQAYYLSAKAAYNNAHAIGGQTTWTSSSVDAAFRAAGLTPEQHYTQYGWTEGLSPDAYYVESEYVASKVAQLNATSYQGRTTWTSSQFYSALNGGNPFMHYVNSGAYEAGVEPSTGFNDDTYYTDKAVYNNAHSVNGITTWTAATVKASFQAAGLTPIGHYELYGQTEAFYTPTPTPVVGQTYTLTTGIDNIPGTSGNDLIIGTVNIAGTGTYSDGDVINGAAGTNTLQLTIGTIDTPATTVKNVQIVDLRNNAVGGSFDMANTDGAVTTVYEHQSAKGLTVNNINSAKMTYSLADLTTASQADTFNFKSGALAATDDTATVLLNNVVGGGTSATRDSLAFVGGKASEGFENIAIKSSTAASALLTLSVTDNSAIPASTLKSVTITGDKDLTILNALDFTGTTGTVDASKFTGKLNVNLADPNSAGSLTVTGGSGNDTFLFGTTLTSTDSVDGGTGTNTLGADLFADVVAAAGSLKNIQTVQLQVAPTASATLDASKISGLSTITFGAGTGAAGITSTINNLASGSTIGFNKSSGGGIAQINVKDAPTGTADVLNVNIGTSTTAASILAGTINSTATGVETINIAVNGDVAATYAHTLKIGATDSSLKTITVTGNEGFTLDYSGASLTNYDANALTGATATTSGMFSTGGASITGGSKDDSLLGNTGTDVITGNAGNDFLFGGTGATADTMTGGAGSDTFFMYANGNTANMVTGVLDTVTDMTMGSGGDNLNFFNVAATPVQDGTMSTVKVNNLNGGLPSGGTAGRAELIVLDSSVGELQAANASALSAKLFGLTGAGTYSDVLVAYAASDTSPVRIATATIVLGDITNIVDLGVISNLTTSTIYSGFDASNITGLPSVGATLIASGNPFNTLTGANITGGTKATSGNDLIQSTYANLNNVADTIDGSFGTNTLEITDAITGDLDLSAYTTPLANISTLQMDGASGAFLVTAPNLTGLTVTNTAGASTVQLGSAAQTYNAGAAGDTVTLGAASQTVVGGAGGDTIGVGQLSYLTGLSVAGGGGADTLVLGQAGAGTISNVAGVAGLTLAAASNQLTMTSAQYTVFTPASITGGIFAGNSITFTTANAALGSLAAAVGRFTLADGVNAATLGATGQTVIGGTGADAITASSVTLAGSTLTLGAGAGDRIIQSDALAYSYLGNAGLTGVDAIELSAGSAGATIMNGAGITVTNTALLAGTSVVTLGTGGQTFTTTSTGANTVTGGTGADTITGGITTDTLSGAAGNDSITGGSGSDLITGGAGNDVINLTEGAAAVDTLQYAETGVANVDTVSGFTVNSDNIVLSAAPTLMDGDKTVVDGAGTAFAVGGALGTRVTVAVDGGAGAANAAAANTYVAATSATATSFGSSLGTSLVTVAGQVAGANVVYTYYDSATSQAVVGMVDATSDGVVTSISKNDTFSEVSRLTMTSVDYLSMTTTSFGAFI